ncbi:thiazolylpeptide-type bacteriocin [Curtobacterium aurantiacum]|uniref:thiazolylpeptide-type bacteriocin n=1 Tax=Curtobacterium aurantiacum TaxID=3236919 RepID=UPI0034604E97
MLTARCWIGWFRGEGDFIVERNSIIDLPDLDFSGLEVLSVREAVAVPETGATSGSSSCTSTSCCGSSSCCSSGSCG